MSNFYIRMTNAAGVGLTGLSVSCQKSLDGAALSGMTNTPVEIGSGIYKLNLTAAETTANSMAVLCTGGSALPFVVFLTPEQ